MSEEAVKRNTKNVRKGSRAESNALNTVREMGYPAARKTILSGQYSSTGIPELHGDLKLGFTLGEGGQECTAEVKSRRGGAGFSQLYKWLVPGTDMLLLTRDRCQTLCVMDIRTLCFFLQYVPTDLRLPPGVDRLRGLRMAAKSNPYAAATLRKLEGFQKQVDEDNPLATMQIPNEGDLRPDELPDETPDLEDAPPSNVAGGKPPF